MSAAMISLNIDGRHLQAPAGTPLLQVARQAGIEIPTLCDHPALEPVGSCRLCLVEVTHPDWKRWSGLMTACLYPASADLVVQTDSPRVRRARRQVLSLLAARCPQSPEIQALAARHGASAEGLCVDPDADRCILCGLCTRVCETYATSAITTFSRGSTKAVGPFLDRPPEECVGCGACSSLCPTGTIEAAARGAHYQIWGRSFDAAVCTVDEQRCLGCGACEEACPFAVARVRLRAGGERLAAIPATECRGCGACVGACPTGAIDQATPYTRAELAPATGARGVAVVACTRCGLRGNLPDSVQLVEVPCTGRVTLPLLLALAARHDGVLVLGRHPETCRLGGAERAAEERCTRAAALLALVGVGGDRLRFAQAAAGPSGPRQTLEAFRAELERLPPSPLARRPPPALEGEGLEQGVQLLRWMARQPGLRPASTWTEHHGLAAARAGAPTLNPGELLALELLAGPEARPLSVAGLLRQGLEVLSSLGLPGAGVALGSLAPTDQSLGRWLALEGSRLPRPPKRSVVACDGSARSRALLDALGYDPLPLGPDPLPSSLELGSEDRRRAEELLGRAEEQGAVALLVDSPLGLLRWTLLTRQGSWRSTRLRPVLAHQLAWASLHGGSIDLPAATEEVAP